MFKIGNVEIKNNVVLAPMAGVSNPPFMKICEEMNVGYAVTELISSEAIIRDNKKTLDMLEGYDKLNIPVAIQIFGSNPIVMGQAAKIIEEKIKPDIIDINIGCPVPKVALRAKAGSALLKEPNKIYDIVKKVKESVSIPVTIKIRSGWDKNSINAVEVAKIAEKAGCDAICVHPRTRSEGYTGKADWSIIKKVKESVSIPVIGNGDITDIYSAKKMIDETKCDAIMVGRSVLGNPYLIKEIVSFLNDGKIINKQTPIEKMDTCLKHFDYLIKLKGEKTAVLEMRTHAAWYLKGLPSAVSLKKQIYGINSKDEFIKLIENYKKSLKNNEK